MNIMKTYLHSLLKSLGLTAGLDAALLLLLYTACPVTVLKIGQAGLMGGVILLLLIASCLYALISVHRRRELLFCLAVSFLLHVIASVASVLVYGNRLSYFWPGHSDMAWLLFFVLIVTVWCLTVSVITIIRYIRMSATRREETKHIQHASLGLRMETDPVTPARARLIATLKGFTWTIGFYILTGFLLEMLKEMSIAETILSYVAFPCLWCLMGIVYGYVDRPNRVAFTLSVTVTHILLCAATMVFLLPSNVTKHVGYALLYLDSILMDPFNHPEQLLLVAEFLSVWVIALIYGIGHRRKKYTESIV